MSDQPSKPLSRRQFLRRLIKEEGKETVHSVTSGVQSFFNELQHPEKASSHSCNTLLSAVPPKGFWEDLDPEGVLAINQWHDLKSLETVVINQTPDLWVGPLSVGIRLFSSSHKEIRLLGILFEEPAGLYSPISADLTNIDEPLPLLISEDHFDTQLMLKILLNEQRLATDSDQLLLDVCPRTEFKQRLESEKVAVFLSGAATADPKIEALGLKHQLDLNKDFQELISNRLDASNQARLSKFGLPFQALFTHKRWTEGKGHEQLLKLISALSVKLNQDQQWTKHLSWLPALSAEPMITGWLSWLQAHVNSDIYQSLPNSFIYRGSQSK